MAHPSTAHETSEFSEQPSFRGRILALLGIEIIEIDFEDERLQFVFSQMQSKNESDMHRLKEAIGNQPKASSLLGQFLDPELEYEDAFELLQDFNEACGPLGKRHGRSYHANLSLPHGRSLTIHLFPEMDYTLSADMDWHA